MKKQIVAVAVGLTLLLAAATGFLVSKKKSNVEVIHELQLIETAYMVVHPGANKGDTIVFPAFSESGITTNIHFPLQSPCAEHDLTGTPDHPPQCKVTADVTATTVAQYPYAVEKGPVVVQGKSRCKQSCCPGCLVVIPNPTHPHGQIPPAPTGSGPYPAVEILIDDSDTGVAAGNAAAYPGQPVQWFRSGTVDTEWSVTFDDPTACKETKPIGTGITKSLICTVNGTVQKSPYRYTMNVGGKMGTAFIYVNPAIPLDAKR